MRAGGFWRCAVRKREQQRKVDQARRDVKTARQREQHHETGWLTRRRRDLANQRARIHEQLQQLEQEADACRSAETPATKRSSKRSGVPSSR
jgi:hypothetical protein